MATKVISSRFLREIVTHRIGIVGIGSVADTHARGIQSIEGSDLVAASSRTHEIGEAFAEKYDCSWYGDNEDLYADAGIDIALVCTPSGEHLEPVAMAAEHGIDVLCEKPLEITTARAEEHYATFEHPNNA